MIKLERDLIQVTYVFTIDGAEPIEADGVGRLSPKRAEVRTNNGRVHLVVVSGPRMRPDGSVSAVVLSTTYHVYDGDLTGCPEVVHKLADRARVAEYLAA